jgi:hypothetical protein
MRRIVAVILTVVAVAAVAAPAQAAAYEVGACTTPCGRPRTGGGRSRSRPQLTTCPPSRYQLVLLMTGNTRSVRVRVG